MKNKLLRFLLPSMFICLTGCNFLFSGDQIQGQTKLEQNISDLIEHNYYAVSSCPCLGSPKVLVIPVWFTNSSNYISSSKKETVRSDIKTAYFGTNEETGWRSVKTFYEEESWDYQTNSPRFSLTGTVANWYECGKSSTYYGNDDNCSKTVTLLESAVSDYFSKSGESRSSYDYDKDGYIDSVILIYGAPDYDAADNDYENLWAYCFWTSNDKGTIFNPSLNAFCFASYDFMYGSSDAYAKTGQSVYSSGDTRYCNVDAHTYIHEFGHLLGLEDLYDYSSKYKPSGAFSMQDCNIGGHDPFSLMLLGWIDPYIISDADNGVSLELSPFQSSHQVILLSPSFNQYYSPFDEYILIEHYTPTGLNELDCEYSYGLRSPKGPSNSGLRVWHVDARLKVYDTNNMTNHVYNSSLFRFAMSNTYYSATYADYCSPMGEGYYNYNLLEYIRSNQEGKNTNINNSNLFTTGDVFSVSKYSNQFLKAPLFNNNQRLDWSFSVIGVNSTKAVIRFDK